MKKVTYDIIIPKVSDEIIDCQLARWLKDIGDYVYEGDVIVELETEKTTIEIESPTDGTLEEIYVFEGEEVIDGERIGVINADESYSEDDEDDIDAEDDSPVSEYEYAGTANKKIEEAIVNYELDEDNTDDIRSSLPGADSSDSNY